MSYVVCRWHYIIGGLMIMPPEDGEWKIVHRHVDAITTARPAESVIQR